ncbi:GUN4 domain-containing protein [Prochlorothrix hollandica]|uniref:GUN4 domain-containing protein n=1 Tax=Prochlorothrix hollandica TaxID=1223 RepID=UPI00333EA6D6
MSAPLATRSVQILQKTYQLPLLQGDTIQAIQNRIKTRQSQIRQGTVTRSRMQGLLKQTQKLSAQERIDLLNAQVQDYRTLIQVVTSHKKAYQGFLLELAVEVRQVFAKKCQQIQRDEQDRAKDEAYAHERNNPALVVNFRQEKRELLEELVLLDKATSLMLKKIDLICQGLDRIANDKALQENLVLGLAQDLEVYKRSISRRQRAQERREDTRKFADMALNFEDYMRQYLGPFQQLIDQTAVTDQGMGRTVAEIGRLAEEVLGSTANLANLEDLLKLEVVSAEIQDHLGLALERAALEQNWAGGGLGLISDQELDATSVTAAIAQIQGHLTTELDRLQASYLAEEMEQQRQAALEAERMRQEQGERRRKEQERRRKAEEAQRKAEEERRRQEAERWNIDAVPLQSEKGVNYRRLRDLLKAGQWKEADQETYQQMLEATNRTSERWFREEDLLYFPCADLKTIDQLWVRASQGRYGFSVQKEIYVNCGAKLDGTYPDGTVLQKYGEKVGWWSYWLGYWAMVGGSTFVSGQLPFLVYQATSPWLRWGGLRVVRWRRFSSLASRLVNCSR